MTQTEIQKMMWGNKVFVSITGGDGRLTEITCNFQELFDIQQGHLKAIPIPISEGLLEKRCGFLSYVKGSGLFKENKSEIIITRKTLPNGGFLLVYKDMKFAINFLHELQNYWLMLFGEPLKILPASTERKMKWDDSKRKMQKR